MWQIYKQVYSAVFVEDSENNFWFYEIVFLVLNKDFE